MMYIEKSEFEKVVDNYADVIYRCAYTICKNKSDAEDVVQETFIRYLSKTPKFDDESHRKAWLLRVAINLSKDLMKSFWRKNKTEISEYITDEKNEFEKCEIWEDIKRLPAKYRIVLELYYHEGYTIEEISKITRVKKSTVGDRLAKAKKLLGDLYKEV